MTEAEQDRNDRFAARAAAARCHRGGGRQRYEAGLPPASRADAGRGRDLAVTPYYNKTTQAGLIEHFTRVADAAELPVILYNVPARTGLNLLPETAMRLSGHPLIRALKEASADLRQMTEDARLLAGRMAVYCGNDEYLFTGLALGAEARSRWRQPRAGGDEGRGDRYFAGENEQIRSLQRALSPLIERAVLEVSPIPVKE